MPAGEEDEKTAMRATDGLSPPAVVPSHSGHTLRSRRSCPMRCRNQQWIGAAALVLAVAAGVGWVLYYRERQKAEDLARKADDLAATITAVWPEVAGFRARLDAAK